jgi:hypothetical protein
LISWCFEIASFNVVISASNCSCQVDLAKAILLSELLDLNNEVDISLWVNLYHALAKHSKAL